MKIYIKPRKILEKLLHSIVHRSGIMIDVRNAIVLKDFDPSSRIINLRAQRIINQIAEMSTGVPLKLIGKLHLDGSYPIVQTKRTVKTRVISIGVGNNIIFDKKMARLGASVWLYDHTTAPNIHKIFWPNITYSKIGVSSKIDTKNCLTLSEILDKSVSNKKFDQTILKMDCEGEEWDVFIKTPYSYLSKIDQIIVEFHNLDKISTRSLSNKYIEVFQKLKKHFVVTYIATNNFTPIVKLKNGKSWPFTVEMHLLIKSRLKEFDDSDLSIGLPNSLGFKKRNWHLSKEIGVKNWF
jgi:hypothetical protein